MESQALHLGEMICARVCHDLGGLAGTLAGALDLAQDEGGGEAIALARETADALARRLRLVRAAFGPVSEPLGAPGIADLAAGLDERVRVDVSGLGRGSLTGEQARLALAMLMLGAEALPAGGIVQVSAEAGGALRVVAQGPRAAWRPGVVQGLAGAMPGGPRDLLAPLCALLARAARMGLAAEEAPPALRAMPSGHQGQRPPG
jgi:histidine phosphotransferase ChpT